MSKLPAEPDREALALLEKLGPAPQRDPRAAENGKSKFLAEARTHRASIFAEREERHTGWKANAMGLTGVPAALLVVVVIVLIGVMGVSVLMMTGPVMGNSFSTINMSLYSVGNSRPAAVPPNAENGSQKVIKSAAIRLLVKDTDRALDGVTQTVVDVQGYLISSRTWYQDYNGTNDRYATVTIGVPVEQFENALRRLRSLGVRVLDENVSGQDVTEQYVDLQSQVTNLEATRDRIKSSLDQATTIDDVLRINVELSRLEVQAEQIRKQMNYLSNRSAFSIVTINLEPELPHMIPAPLPTSTPMPPQGVVP